MSARQTGPRWKVLMVTAFMAVSSSGQATRCEVRGAKGRMGESAKVRGSWKLGENVSICTNSLLDGCQS